MSEFLPTRTNGGIPPDVSTLTLTMVKYAVGHGIEGDPVRIAKALYLEDGTHLLTIDPPNRILYNESAAAGL